MILDEIIANKRREVAAARKRVPVLELRAAAADMEAPRDFIAAFSGEERPYLLAEIKAASPSAGAIRGAFDPAAIARQYERAGAAALSVLTDEKYFKGSLEHMRRARAAVALPTLRKEFIVDPYQVYESRAAGADAILLMTQVLSITELKELLELAHSLAMAAFVEGHTGEEIDKAVASGARLIGINNRDLRTFKTDLRTTAARMRQIPGDRLVISQSSMHSRDDVACVEAAGVAGIQVGEALMRSGDIEGKIKELLGRD